jgi:hypothetical protein
MAMGWRKEGLNGGWIPAAGLETFNDNIVGAIELIAEFRKV